MSWIKGVFLFVNILSQGLAAAVNGGGGANAGCIGLGALSPKCRPVEASHSREVYYVGGHYKLDASSGQEVLVDQVYVEKLTPARSTRQPFPLVFFHGGGYSGAAWLQTPDGRQGMASYFLDRGYQVYLIDDTGSGRSTQYNQTQYPIFGVQTATVTLRGFTRMQDYDDYPQAKLHTQWPGTGRQGDPAFDAISALAIPLTRNTVALETSMRNAGCALLSIIGKSFLISHSIGAVHPIHLSDQCPEFVQGNLNFDPTTIPFEWFIGGPDAPNGGRLSVRPWGLTTIPITYSPPAARPEDLKTVRVGEDTAAKRSCKLQADPPRTLPNINRVPYVAITGEASQHATYDHCIVEYLRQAGGKPEWIQLGQIGIKGNGHFGYLEKNSEEIAKVAEKWFRKHS
ncbi:MAG: hypothetical protein Q9169_005192 [Polycauliona sp. 2 TL-2023]